MINQGLIELKDFAKRLQSKSRKLSVIERLLAVIADIYSVGIIVYLALRLATGYQLWPMSFASQFLHWILIPAFAVFLLMLVLQFWYRALAASVGVIMFLWLFGGLFLPIEQQKALAASDSCHNLKVMTYNTGAGLAKGDALAEYLLGSGADIIGLQEITQETTKIEEALSDHYPYQFWDGFNADGLALLSRYPILEVEFIDVHWQHLQPYIQAVVDIKGQPVQVIVHRGHPPGFGEYPERTASGQVIFKSGFRLWRNGESLVEAVATDLPTLLLMDLNVTDQSPDHKFLREGGFVDLYRSVGRGFGSTFPAREGRRNLPDLPPLVRIDYIWATTDFLPMEAQVEAGADSDHFPVLATICLQH